LKRLIAVDHASGEKRDASGETGVIHRDPFAQLDAAAVAQPHIE